MKKVLVVSMVATVLTTSVVSAVSAAPAVKPAASKAQVHNSTLTINGNSVVVRSIVKNGETLVSLRDVIKAIGAQAEVHSGTTVIKLNGHTVQLTTSTDDKVFVWSVDGQKAYYVSVPSEDGNASLQSVDSSQEATTVYGVHDVEQAILSGDVLYVLVAQDDSNSVIISIDTVTGKQTKLYTVSSDVSSITVAGPQIAVIENGRVLVQAAGSWRAVTK
ncbi:hypothetical protein MHB85_23660 [Paenibacillus sp. FSL K6-4396]|uniref:stalk domain-containing protein n=1 Tax=unclassified Paenibacillus TaxID=185978 RepID=UPI001FD30B3B|nr:hypothetical protein [Paenibacillus sp. CFBP 13594]